MNDEERNAPENPSPEAPAWAAEACTLPSVEQPLRIAEFDTLFAGSLRQVQRPEPTRARLVLGPGVEDTVRELAARESECCSFFTFTVAPAENALLFDVAVSASHVAVLDALTTRAAAQLAAS
jgi:hypothetical protein